MKNAHGEAFNRSIKRPKERLIRKGIAEVLPTASRKATSCSRMQSAMYSTSVSKNIDLVSLKILAGGEKLLKPALRVMSEYRLRIDEIKGAEVVTSYTRWLASVEARGSVNQKVYVAFSPDFERIWLKSKKRLPE